MEGVEGVEVRDVMQPGAGQFKVESAHGNGYEKRIPREPGRSSHHQTRPTSISSPEVQSLGV